MSIHLDADVWLSLADAAERLGLSRHQLRRRIRAGRIASRQIAGPHGPSYEVCVDPDVTVTSTAHHTDGRHPGATVSVTPPLTELVNLLAGTQAELVRTAAAAGMWQARAEMLADQLHRAQLALAAPAQPTMPESALGRLSDNAASEPTEAPAETPKPRHWWLFWR